MKKKYDVIIVGGGPAGIFTALELTQQAGLSILLVEKGKDISKRSCPVRDKGGACVNCSPCNVVSGLGGAGAFSDGKLTLSPEVGGQLKDYQGEERTQELIHYVDNIYLKFGASDKLYGMGNGIEQLRHKASLAELRLVPVMIRLIVT